MTNAESAGRHRFSFTIPGQKWLRERRVAPALLFVTLSATGFQFITIAAAAAAGGTTGVGRYSLVLTATTALSFLLGSDYRSLIVSHIMDGRDLRLLGRFRITSGASLVILWVFLGILLHDLLWIIVGLFRLSASIYDGELAKAQAHKDTPRIYLMGGFLYGLGSLWFAVGPKLGLSFELVFSLYVAVSFVPLVSFRKHYPRYILTSPSLRDFSSVYFALGAAGFLGLAPQFLVRWFLGNTGDLSFVGNFSLDYQLALCGIPLITAFSQHFMARSKIDRADIRRGTIQVALMASLIASPTAATTIPYFRNLISFFFHGYFGLGPLDKLMVVVTSILTYVVVFHGFVSVRTPARSAQLSANVIFISILIAGSAALGRLSGPSGVIAAMLIATFARSYCLARAVFRAVPSRGHCAKEPNS